MSSADQITVGLLLQEPHPCCNGYFCPPALTCMMPCPLGAFCSRWPSAIVPVSILALANLKEALRDFMCLMYDNL